MADSADVWTSAAIVLTEITLITKKIFTFLPVKSLNSCVRVCKIWKEVAEQVKRRRHNFQWKFYLCEGDSTEDFLATEIKYIIQNLWYEPSTFISFCATTMYNEPIKVPSKHTTRFPRIAKCARMDIGIFLKQILPSACKFLAISADGVVGTSSDMSRTVEMENKKSLSFMVLPEFEGLEIYSFTVDIHTYASRLEDPMNELFDVKKVSTIPEGKDVKAILFFCNEPFCPPEIGYTLLQHYRDSVVAGGYVDNLICPQKCTDDPTGKSVPSLMCIAFSGERLRVASVIIEEDVNCVEDVEATIRLLKDCKLPEERSFAFMFACVGRGCHHYGAANVEADIFRKFFPKTPLLGFFGNGEVGFNYLPKEGIKQKNGKRPLPKLYHAYTTIMCLLSVV